MRCFGHGGKSSHLGRRLTYYRDARHARGRSRRTDERLDRRTGRGAGGGRAEPPETDRLLRVARDVAHRVERKDTPLATFLLGMHVARRTADGRASRASPSTRRSRPPTRSFPPRPNSRSAEHAARVGWSHDRLAPAPHPAPAEGPLVDSFGRVADDLRVSVTDRCNFRCTYCMPAEGLAWLPKSEILTFEEIDAAARHLRRPGRQRRSSSPAASPPFAPTSRRWSGCSARSAPSSTSP